MELVFNAMLWLVSILSFFFVIGLFTKPIKEEKKADPEELNIERLKKAGLWIKKKEGVEGDGDIAVRV